MSKKYRELRGYLDNTLAWFGVVLKAISSSDSERSSFFPIAVENQEISLQYKEG
jgi:hypothetical protein